MRQSSKRHHGTFYYAGALFGSITCGHRHATVRTTLPCKRKLARDHKNVRVFMAYLGVFPAKPLD